MPVPIPPATPSTPPVAPQRTEPTTFSARMDAWLAWFNASFWVWVYDLVPWIQARANETEAWSNTASASAAAASASQTSAADSATTATTAIVTVTQQAAAAAATSGTISSVAAAASASATSASASSTAAAVARDAAIAAWAAAAAPIEQLASISKSLHVGAVVKSIIYDTSKDSDGGAWRKRMQDKSWYNETLGGNAWIGQQPSEAVARASVGSLASPQLVVNGTFPINTNGWTLGNSSTLSVVAGKLRLTNTAALNGIAYQAITTEVGKTYLVSADHTAGTNSSWFLYAGTTAGGNQLGTNGGPLATVTSSTFTFVATTTTSYISVLLNATNGHYADFDNISVKLSEADTSNYLYQSTTDGKFYRTNGNLLADTNGFFNQWSTDSVATRNSVSVTAPDGSATVIQLVSSVGGPPYVYTNPVVVSGNTYTYSMYVKLGTGGDGTVRLDNTTRSANATFNLSTGAAGAVTNCTSAIVSVGSGWYRCSMTYTATTSAANTHDIVLLGTFSAGQGHYIWGAQLELGSVVQSYKPVTTTYVGSQTEQFRGITREFPAVVAIVAESSRVVIYDLTQSGSPMWRVYLTGANFALHSGTVTSVATINGIIAVCVSVGQLATLDFPADRTFIRNSVNYYSNTSGHKANSFAGAFVVLSSVGLVNNTVNDVAITVLDNAPIDPATGLPVPTIAVATAGGISVLKDDGTAVTIAGQAQAVTASYFDADNRIVATGAYQNELGVYAIPTSNVSYVASLAYYTNSGVAGGTNPKPLGNSSSGYRLTRGPSKTVAVGSMNLGVSLLKENPSSQGRGMVNYITNAYNSGWLPGDIRGAFLADTVAETVTASGELVTNGTNPTVATGWTPNLCTVSVVSSEIELTATATNTVTADFTITTVVGETYQISGSGYRKQASGSVGLTVVGIVDIAQSTPSAITALAGVNFVATSSSTLVRLRCVAATTGDKFAFNFVSTKLAEPDRSVKNKGLVINGTLTKTAVASGAGLVAYSGFSASNYLEQPYNSDLDFGTGDFCVMGWYSATSAGTGTLLCRGLPTVAGSLMINSTSAGAAGIYISGGLSWVTNYGTFSIPVSAGLHFLTVSRASGVFTVTADGANCPVTVGAGSLASTVTVASSSVFQIGNRIDTSSSWTGGSLALWRVSATAPSADQIAHIYRTELPLFQANAQCTIAGTSTAVTALAYDDVADELHVGTSWGRSEFKDLLRVASEATTTGSITSLSANEGVVINAGTSAKIYAPALYLRDELRRTFTASKALAKQLMWQEFYATEGQATFTCSKNGDVRAVYVNNILRKAPVDYTVSSDGFQNIITFTSGISAGIQVSVQTTRS